MSYTDPIADMLTRIRNDIAIRRSTTTMPTSKLKLAILGVLKSEGYIRDFYLQEEAGSHAKVVVELKYNNDQPVIRELDRVSKPGRRMYSSISDLQKVHNGLGIYILSTSKGVMSDHQARLEQVGGEVLCKVF
jgi:small subunit ribosomal protein S8